MSAQLADEMLSAAEPDPGHASPLDAEWLKEAEDRLAAHRSGELPAVDADEVFKELDRRT